MLHRHIIVIPQGISIICKFTCCLPFLISTQSAQRCITFIMYLILSPSYLHICTNSELYYRIPIQSLYYLRYKGLSLGRGVCIGSALGSYVIVLLSFPFIWHVLKRFPKYFGKYDNLLWFYVTLPYLNLFKGRKFLVNFLMTINCVHKINCFWCQLTVVLDSAYTSGESTTYLASLSGDLVPTGLYSV